MSARPPAQLEADGCVSRLVAQYGSQAEVARAFQIDRAVVNHWVKSGYVPARWASEVERITQGRISAADIVNEASAKKPVRVKSRPEDAPFGILPESDPMSSYAPTKRIQSVITSYSIHYTKLYEAGAMSRSARGMRRGPWLKRMRAVAGGKAAQIRIDRAPEREHLEQLAHFRNNFV